MLERFESAGVRYITNLHGGNGLGKSWMDVFRTKDRGEVETRLQADGYRFEWKRNGGLRTELTAAATLTHPVTSEAAWVNQAEQWHPSSLGPDVRKQLLSVVPEADLPHNASLGDGAPLRDDDLQCIRDAMAAEVRMFDWEEGDVLLCDNILVMHGRKPFSGARQVYVAMD